MVLAIPKNKENISIKNTLRHKDIFLGSENDVLDRYYKAAKKFNADIIVRICGDCPFIDPFIIDEILDLFKNNNYDYISNTIKPTFPDGFDVEVFNFSVLKEVWGKAKKEYEREHVTPYILNSKKFKKLNYSYKNDLSSLRLTIDEEVDLKQINIIYSYLKNKNSFGINDINKLYNKNNKIFDRSEISNL